MYPPLKDSYFDQYSCEEWFIEKKKRGDYVQYGLATSLHVNVKFRILFSIETRKS